MTTNIVNRISECTNEERAKLEKFQELVMQLIAMGETEGVVITIKTVPFEPLAMRRYFMSAEIRLQR